MKTINIQCVTRLQDNGDGGYTMFFYNSNEELLADHPNGETFNIETREFGQRKLTEEEEAYILNEEDPYENGYIGTQVISIIIDDDGNAQLTPEGFSAHAGQ